MRRASFIAVMLKAIGRDAEKVRVIASARMR